jgi:Domain of unknown function (DUF4157)
LVQEHSTISPRVQAATAAESKIMPAQEPLREDIYKETLQALPIQRKLSIGAVDDPLEQEADAMADTVMRMPEQPFVQRKCAHCEEEEQVQMKPLAASITPFIQAKGAQGGTASDGVTSKINSTRGSGSNMDRPTQSFMESRFGTDFSNVKIHTGDDAVQMSRELNAQAFTVGSDIYFNSGKYNPSSESGKHLLAHELTHTVQQGGNISRMIQRACGGAEIGTPAGCTHDDTEAPLRPRYLFEVNCDTFLTGNELDLRADAAAYGNGDEIEIHGLASEEGGAGFNENLSCARALRARAVIQSVLTARGITARITVFSHGAQPGGRTINRSVAIVHRPVPAPVEEEDPVPAGPPACSGIYTDGHDETTDGDHDLDQLHHSGERSPDIIFYDYIGGETGALIDFNVGFFGGTMFESTTDDDDLYNHFVSGSGSRMNFTTSTDMARIIGSSPTFTSFASGFETAVLAHIAATGTLCGFDGDTYLATNRPAYFHSPLFAWAVMGGYARLDASVAQTPGGGISVTYRIYDHYGAGVSDAWSYLLGLSALYYLQHFHGVSGSSYTPFIWSVQINRTSP